MNNQELLERFSALFNLVKESHDNCHQQRTDVMELIDVFAQHHCLGLAFKEDCEALLPKEGICSADLTEILNSINNALWCGASHLRENAHRLNSPIIDYFLQRIVAPIEHPN